MGGPVDAVLFDLDDTLCAYRRSSVELLELAFDELGVDPLFPPTAYYERYERLLGEYDDMVAFRTACFVDAARAHGGDESVAREVAELFEAERDQRAVDPLPGAVDAVRALAADHHLGLVTNGPRAAQSTKLDAIGLADAFDATVFAGFDAPAKPDPAPFEVALDALGATADRAVHVGNSPSSDVAGAHAAGLRSVWLREDGREPDPEPHHVVDSLAALTERPWE